MDLSFQLYYLLPGVALPLRPLAVLVAPLRVVAALPAAGPPVLPAAHRYRVLIRAANHPLVFTITEKDPT